MPAQPENNDRLQFGDFIYEPDNGRLTGPNGTQTLRPRLARLLEALLAQPGTLINRQTLAEAVWGQDRVVEFEAGLAALIKELRAALGDQASSPTFIETVPRRGLRFLIHPTPVQQTAPSNNRELRQRPVFWMAIGLIVLLATGLAFLILNEQDPATNGVGPEQRSPRIAVLPFLSVEEDEREGRPSLLLADSLIGALGQSARPAEDEPPAYAVIGRTSVSGYPTDEELLPRLGRDLGVDLMVEGSYRREDGNWLIIVSAVKMRDQTILHTRSYLSEELTSRETREHLLSFAQELRLAIIACGQDCLADRS